MLLGVGEELEELDAWGNPVDTDETSFDRFNKFVKNCEEELKKLKQLKMRQVSANKGEQLPWRIRIFERFKARPEMVKVNSSLI